MLARLLKLLSGEAVASEADFGEAELRLAAAALLVHASHIDGEVTGDEQARLAEVLRARFHLSANDLDVLLHRAEAADAEAVDLYRFTSVLCRHLDQDGRKKIIEMLWEIVLADGKVHEYEDNLVARVAELIGVAPRDRILLRRRIADRG